MIEHVESLRKYVCESGGFAPFAFQIDITFNGKHWEFYSSALKHLKGMRLEVSSIVPAEAMCAEVLANTFDKLRAGYAADLQLRGISPKKKKVAAPAKFNRVSKKLKVEDVL